MKFVAIVVYPLSMLLCCFKADENTRNAERGLIENHFVLDSNGWLC